MSLVRPHLKCAAPVWDPHLQKDIQLLEDTQKFACRMCNMSSNAGYNELLEMSHLPSSSDHRLYLKLCSVLKVLLSTTFICQGDQATYQQTLFAQTAFCLHQLLYIFFCTIFGFAVELVTCICSEFSFPFCF